MQGDIFLMVYIKIFDDDFMQILKENEPSDIVEWFENFKTFVFGSKDPKERAKDEEKNHKKLKHIQENIYEWCEYIYEKYINIDQKDNENNNSTDDNISIDITSDSNEEMSEDEKEEYINNQTQRIVDEYDPIDPYANDFIQKVIAQQFNDIYDGYDEN